MRRTTPMKGDIVKFDGHYCKIAGITHIDCSSHFVLEIKKNGEILTGAIPVTSVRWNGKQFVADLE